MFRAAVLLWFVAALTSPCVGQQTGSLRVIVLDEQGAVIPRANIRVGDLDTSTGSDGVASIERLTPGTYQVTAKFRGFRDGTTSDVVIVGGKQTEVTITLGLAPPNPSDIRTSQTLDPRRHSRYSKFLQQVKEPELCQQAIRPIHAYRFLWLPTFAHPVFIRVDIQPDGTALLRLITLSGEGGYAWGTVQTDKSRKLSWEEEADLFITLADIGFWTLPTRVEDPFLRVLDGTDWLIEGVRDGNCRLVDRYSSPLTDMFSQRFLSAMAKLKPYYQGQP